MLGSVRGRVIRRESSARQRGQPATARTATGRPGTNTILPAEWRREAGIEIEAGGLDDYYIVEDDDAESSEMRRAAARVWVEAVFTGCRCAQGHVLISLPPQAGSTRHNVERAGAQASVFCAGPSLRV